MKEREGEREKDCFECRIRYGTSVVEEGPSYTCKSHLTRHQSRKLSVQDSGRAKREAERSRLAGIAESNNFSTGVRNAESKRSNLRSLKRFAGAQRDNWLRGFWLGFPIIWHCSICNSQEGDALAFYLTFVFKWKSIQICFNCKIDIIYHFLSSRALQLFWFLYLYFANANMDWKL